jgi:hypothetical protein
MKPISKQAQRKTCQHRVIRRVVRRVVQTVGSRHRVRPPARLIKRLDRHFRRGWGAMMRPLSL